MEFEIAEGAPAGGLKARALAASPRRAKRGVADAERLLWWSWQAKPHGMTSLMRAFALAVAQLSDPAIRRVLVKTLLVTLAIFFAFGAMLWAIIPRIFAAYGLGTPEVGGLLSFVVAFFGAWLLFRFVALAVLNFFADEVVRAVEKRHYPDSAALPEARFATELAASMRSLAVAVAVNLLALPVALILLVTGIGAPLAFLGANAWLMGRELTQMVWLRHRATTGVRWPLGAGTRLALGGVVAAMLAVPGLNLLAPVLGAAAATHLVHRRSAAHA